MPRPTSKTDLIAQTQTNYAKLQAELDKLSDAEKTAPDVVGVWSVKDVLAHLFAWQQMVLDWYETGKRGETPIVPHPDYNWRQIPDLNQHIYETYRDVRLEDITAQFEASHQKTLQTIESISNAELFTANVYAWTKTTTLGSYFTSATSSHYDWARKEIRRGLKAK